MQISEKVAAEKVREKVVRSICIYLCLRFGIAPTDPLDSSENWWMFSNDVEGLLDALEKRNFKLKE